MGSRSAPKPFTRIIPRGFIEAESRPASTVLGVVVGSRAAKISMIGPIQLIMGTTGQCSGTGVQWISSPRPMQIATM